MQFILIKRKKWDNVRIGISSELMYLPYSGLHYVDFQFLGNIDGIDQWLHHYDHDRYRLVYLIGGIKAKYEIKKMGYISFQKAYSITLYKSGQTQDLYLNNKTGAYNYGPWEDRTLERVSNPHVITELMIGLEMAKNQYFTFGFQWFSRSSIDLNFTQYIIDSREQAFRNVKIGWQISL